jgi:chemotaxis protein MotA
MNFKRFNLTLAFGLLLGILIIFGSVAYEIDGASAAVFVHPVAIFIVFGGTLTVSFISTPIDDLKRIVTRTIYVIRFPRNDFRETLRDILHVSVGSSKDVLFLEKFNKTVHNAMFRDGLVLIGMGFKSEEIRRFLEIKKNQNEGALAQCAVLFFNMAKTGPAFGLLGTLVGLIILLYYHMGSGDMAKVASSMGVALTATLYGVGLANLIFQPLAEYMQYNAENGAALDDMVIEGTIQIKERRHPIYLLQALKAYMPREDYDVVERIMKEEMNDANKKSPSKGAAA